MRKFSFKAPEPQPAPVPQLSVEEEAIAVDEANQSAQEVEQAANDTDQLGDIIVSMGDAQVVVSNTPEIQPIDQALAAAVSDAAVAGTDANPEEISEALVPAEGVSTESFVQSVKDAVVRIWEAIKASITKMWEAVKAFFASIANFFNGTKRRLKALQNLMAENTGVKDRVSLDGQMFEGFTRYLTAHGDVVSVPNGLHQATNLAVGIVAATAGSGSKVMERTGHLGDIIAKDVHDSKEYCEGVWAVGDAVEEMLKMVGLKPDSQGAYVTDERVMGGLIVSAKIPFKRLGAADNVMYMSESLQYMQQMRVEVQSNHADKWNNKNAAKIPLLNHVTGIREICKDAEFWIKEVEAKSAFLKKIDGEAAAARAKISKGVDVVKNRKDVQAKNRQNEDKRDLNEMFRFVGRINSILSILTTKVASHHTHVVNAALDYAFASYEAIIKASGGQGETGKPVAAA